ncbi:helix-turn-helix domain-containing protein [Catenibacterium mitsuokai]|uniref:helix-turn-helix domain-containing protein n=1 Tax=Catenibacterium mitsuokai TaxID=100886 RepID=UPI003D787209
MRICYNKLFKLLIDKNLKKSDLERNAKISRNVLSKLSKNETISMEKLIDICIYLDCTFDDIVEIVKD